MSHCLSGTQLYRAKIKPPPPCVDWICVCLGVNLQRLHSPYVRMQFLIRPLCLFAGRGLHQPGQHRVRVHVGARPGAGGRRVGAGAAGGSADLPLPVLFVHGQRDLVPAEAVPRRGQQGALLGPVSAHRVPAVTQHAAHQRRAWLLHRNLHRAEGVRHAPPAAAAAPHAAPVPAAAAGRQVVAEHAHVADVRRRTAPNGLTRAQPGHFRPTTATYRLPSPPPAGANLGRPAARRAPPPSAVRHDRVTPRIAPTPGHGCVVCADRDRGMRAEIGRPRRLLPDL
jgi:hypothetical protein